MKVIQCTLKKKIYWVKSPFSDSLEHEELNIDHYFRDVILSIMEDENYRQF